MRISDVTIFRLTGRADEAWDLREERLARPEDIYPEFRREGPAPRPAGPSKPATLRHLFVQIDTDEGARGIHGPIGPDQAFLIRTQLRPLLLGRQALATELLWDMLVRSARHGHTGLMMMAISAIDCCLWDLRGKVAGQPVYRLLGGPTRPNVPAYASMLGYSLEPERLAARAREFLQRGFWRQKWFFRHGPGSGAEGMEHNVQVVRTLREALGDEASIMLDCFKSWDADYAVAMARRLLPYGPAWLEEPLMPRCLEGFVRIKSQTGIPLAAGEHLYTRWEVLPFLQAGALDFVQADPEWTGGITELVKICALAAGFGVKVAPHGHHVIAALHVIAAQPPDLCPMAEYLFQHLPRMTFFSKVSYAPAGGHIELPQEPGLLVLDESKIEERQPIDWA